MKFGELVPANRQVHDFLQGITDQSCQAIKLQVLANPVSMNDFNAAVNYMAAAIDLLSKPANTTRSVSSTTSQVSRGGGRGGGRGGRNGRGRRGGRGSG